MDPVTKNALCLGETFHREGTKLKAFITAPVSEQEMPHRKMSSRRQASMKVVRTVSVEQPHENVMLMMLTPVALCSRISLHLTIPISHL